MNWYKMCNKEVVCAWCGTEIGNTDVDDSHGICPNCFKGVTDEMNEAYMPFADMEVGQQFAHDFNGPCTKTDIGKAESRYGKEFNVRPGTEYKKI